MKSKVAKRVNRRVRSFNKQLRKDVFGTRFELRQLKKSYTDGIEYFLYILIDNEQPERNKIIPWETGFAILTFHPLECAMNDFIVSSDFWSKHKSNT